MNYVDYDAVLFGSGIRKKPDLLDGPILKGLFQLSIPLIISNLLQQLYSLVDTFWLGRLGKTAVSAPVISFPILFLLISMAAGLSVAGTSMISQYTGKKQPEKASHAAGQTLLVLLITSIAIAIIGVSIADFALRLVQTPDDAFDLVSQYIKILFSGLPFLFLFFVYQGIMQGYGDTVSPLIIQIISVLLNVILDPLLIFGIGIFPELGVSGAAIATVISRFIGSVAGLYFLLKGVFGLKISLKDIKPDKSIIKKIFQIGIPSSVGQMGSSLGFIVMQGIVNSFGSTVVSAFGVANRLILLFMLPAMGFGQAATAFVGQNVGARKINRATRVVWEGTGVIFLFLMITMTLTFLFGNYFTAFFIPNEPDVIAEGHTIFRIVSYSVVAFGLMFMPMGAFQGAGYTRPVMILNIVRLWGLRIPLAYFLAIYLSLGAKGIWWSMFFSNLLTSLLALWWFSMGKWQKGRV